jgi:hypothetical protein
MEDKLNALEKEREYLLDMCPEEKRDDMTMRRKLL